ncbi:hypothetical protein BV20DRAFT_473914 [Pilatotrama ljubarskyi]|nr:hypothetical protein BV20DRAFT_473914 [Pilatotrama ljubarskyi]
MSEDEYSPIMMTTPTLPNSPNSVITSSTFTFGAAGADAPRRTWPQLLADWDAAKRVLEKREPGVELKRTGTWHFIAVNYAYADGNRPLAVADELESFFHHLLFCALRFAPHNLIDPEDFIVKYFEEFESHPRGPVLLHPPEGRRGPARVPRVLPRIPHAQILQRGPARRGEHAQLPHIDALLGLLNARYEVLQHEADREMEKARKKSIRRANCAAAGTR